jgi:hypothetical protein
MADILTGCCRFQSDSVGVHGSDPDTEVAGRTRNLQCAVVEAFCENPATDKLDGGKDEDSDCKGEEEDDGRVSLKGALPEEWTGGC